MAMTTRELCDRIGVHENTVARWRQEGLPSAKAGGTYVYRWDTVREWLEETGREGYVMIAQAKED